MSEKVKRYLEHARTNPQVRDAMRAAFEQATRDGHFDAVVRHGRGHGHEFSADELIGFITGGKPKQTEPRHG